MALVVVFLFFVLKAIEVFKHFGGGCKLRPVSFFFAKLLTTFVQKKQSCLTSHYFYLSISDLSNTRPSSAASWQTNSSHRLKVIFPPNHHR